MPIRTIAPAAALVAAGAAHGAAVTQFDAFETSNDIALALEMLNDDPGAVYNEATLQGIYEPLAQELYNFGINASVYASPEELMQAWSSSITSGGTIDNGWNATGTDPVSFTNIGGIPDITFDQWNAGDEMAYGKQVPFAQLTASGDAADWGQPGHTYATIELGDVVEEAFVGQSASGFSTWSADGQAYQLNIVPAPASAALLGLAAAAARRRRS